MADLGSVLSRESLRVCTHDPFSQSDRPPKFHKVHLQRAIRSWRARSTLAYARASCSGARVAGSDDYESQCGHPGRIVVDGLEPELHSDGICKRLSRKRPDVGNAIEDREGACSRVGRRGFATVPVMMDLMNDPPNITTTMAGRTMGLHGNAPRVKLPSESSTKARMIVLRNLILSATAPVNGRQEVHPGRKCPADPRRIDITKPDDVSEIQGQRNKYCIERRPLKKLDDVCSPERAWKLS